MMRALYSGVSGLRNHQTRMDVIGNNIANVNTVGFKASRVQFQDVLSQTITGAASAQGNRGGTNPMQVGLGMGLASIDTLFTDGSFQPTGKGTDLSIQGSGFFVLSNGNQQIFTRAGNFDFDTDGNYLVPGTGYRVMGWMADANGNINTSGNVSNIQIPVGATMPALATTSLTYANNLTANNDTIGASAITSRDVYDSLGNPHDVQTTFQKTGTNAWMAYTTVSDVTGTPTGRLRQVTFNADGTLNSISSVTPTTVPQTALTIGGMQLNNTADGATSRLSFTIFDGTGAADAVPRTYTMVATYRAATTDWGYNIYEGEDTTAASVANGTVAWDAVNTQYDFTPTSFTYGTPATTLTMTNTAGTGTAPGAASSLTYAPNYTTAAAVDLAFQPTGGAAAMTVAFDLTDLTQYNGSSTIQATSQNGYTAGTLDTTSIDPSGIIVGKFTNGQSQNLAQVALATFNNPAGLNKVGENLFSESNNSGVAQIGESGTGGRGKFNPGTLEMANVDLANEFSNMIITQRGFQANSKIITVTDEMLDTLANLKR